MEKNAVKPCQNSGNKARKSVLGEKVRENHHAKTIWITGAARIGRNSPAGTPPPWGCLLILTARRRPFAGFSPEELHAAHGTECRIETADLSCAEERSRSKEVLADEHIDIAGFGVCGAFLRPAARKSSPWRRSMCWPCTSCSSSP